eukprot:m.126896 g.126896  ORF g.126896 m.126896 type:complete len:50 (+) comp13845_c1_seq2:526-675(+)
MQTSGRQAQVHEKQDQQQPTTLKSHWSSSIHFTNPLCAAFVTKTNLNHN